MDREEAVRTMAYRMWEEAGKPEGRAMDYWLEAEMAVGRDGPSNGAKAPAKRVRTKTTGQAPAKPVRTRAAATRKSS